MSTEFLSGSRTGAAASLNCMGDSRARFFVLIASAACEFYNLPPAVAPEKQQDFYLVDEPAFCQLVETVYADQRNEFYEWFRHAAATYEGIKGQRIEWEWKCPPQSTFYPIRLAGYGPN